MLKTISQGEKIYIIAGCDDDIRCDGRGCIDFRSLSIENNIFPHVNGSSRVKISDCMDIICSIKMEIVDNNVLNVLDEGFIEVSIDISPSCNLKIDDRKLGEYGSQISQQLQSIYIGSDAIDLKSLCIISGKFCWAIYVDILILQMDGDPLDICSIASYVALHCTKIPKIYLSLGESGKPEDFEISGDLSDSTQLDVSRVPILITLSKIGSSLVLDTTSSEQCCTSSSLSIAIDKNGICCGMFKINNGTLMSTEIDFALQTATKVSESIYKNLEEYHNSKQSSNEVINDFCFPDVPEKRIGLLA